ncbi:hypothetical protein AB0M20_22025 [Actinoplanes sp. NPDC051633]|uniref:hypothetical protein n=1 Tax=Actinoplanes sp. NPDC051633 TaxID=3155670 RepID=UPI00342343E9
MTAILMVVAAALTLPTVSTAGKVRIAALPANTRAMWLWGDDPATEVVDWAAANGVSEIFVYVSPSVRTNGDLARLQTMRMRADARRIKLSALGGDSSWVTDHKAALAWQTTVLRLNLFAGIHLDVEPYLTDGWSGSLETTQRSFLALLDKMRTASTVPLEADVPFWYGEYRFGKANFADEVLKRVSAVTVMSYRDTATGPNSIVEVSRDWLGRGAAAGKRVRLGAETVPLPDCTHCTFHEEGATRLRAELAKVDAATRSAPAFGGIGIHRYGTWRALPA